MHSQRRSTGNNPSIGAKASRGRGGQSPPGETTHDLLKRARGGDRSAIERLCERNIPRLRHWATGRLPRWARDIVDTDDIVQQALIDTLKTIDAFEPHRDGALQAYLRQIVHNRIYDEIRRVRCRPQGSELDSGQMDPEPSPLEVAIGREAMDRYETALSCLNDETRQAVVLRFELDYTYPEIAEALEKPSADAARMAVRRALTRLTEEMGRDK